MPASRAAGIVLGHNTESPSPQEFRDPDEADSLENTVLSVGKRPSSRAYVSYEQGLASTSPLVKINYLLTRSLSVCVQAGLSPAVDLFLHVQFRLRTIYATRPDRLHNSDPQTGKQVRETYRTGRHSTTIDVSEQ